MIKILSTQALVEAPGKVKEVMVIDLARCIGCLPAPWPVSRNTHYRLRVIYRLVMEEQIDVYGLPIHCSRTAPLDVALSEQAFLSQQNKANIQRRLA